MLVMLQNDLRNAKRNASGHVCGRCKVAAPKLAASSIKTTVDTMKNAFLATLALIALAGCDDYHSEKAPGFKAVQDVSAARLEVRTDDET